MFLNTEQEIIDWFLLNSCQNIDDFYFTKDLNDQIIVNSFKSIYLIDVKELPIKFGTINGNFICNFSLESFKGFPEIIKGSLESHSNSFKNTKYWNIKEIDGTINLCGKDCELQDLNFLKDTKFKEIYIKIGNTPFKDDKIDSLILKYSKQDNNYIIMNYDNFKEYLLELNKENNSLDNYLELFNLEKKDLNIINK